MLFCRRGDFIKQIMSGIYVHFPFCKKKCLYCNFYSVGKLADKERYLEALLQEIGRTCDYLPERKIQTLYFGGGTPSLFAIEELAAVIEALKRAYAFSNRLEFTLEANPEQLTKEYLIGLKSLGINRLSIGVQAFRDDILRLLGRRHDAARALQSIHDAAAAGFDNLSIDLIYGIFARSDGDWEQELRQAVELPISHLSAYSLTVEENTLLYQKIKNGTLPPVDDDKAVRDYHALLKIVEAAGFEQYEISNFSRNGKISRHNWGYWTQQPYLGLGAAAHSYNLHERKWNVSDIGKYIEACNQGTPCDESEKLTDSDKFNEYVLLGLRTRKGLDLEEMSQRFGEGKANMVREQCEKLDAGLCRRDGRNISLTAEGLLYADKIAMDLFD